MNFLNWNKRLLILMLAVSVISCRKSKGDFDASGSFEAEETIISSEASGVIKSFEVVEGTELKAGQLVGYIDSTQLFLRKKQLQAQVDALLTRKPNISLQLAALQEQLKTAQHEQMRITALVKGDAATKKQLDDVNAQVDVLRKQIDAQRSTLSISANGIEKDAGPLSVQIEQLNDQLQKCRLINPMNGSVLTRYAMVNEVTAPGKALYKIADMSTMILRVYIAAGQLPQVKINQQVKVLTDDGNGSMKEDLGTIIWVNDKAEFTPKTIQTKDERANTVYAVKVKVKNEGRYKIGMYGEIKFN